MLCTSTTNWLMLRRLSLDLRTLNGFFGCIVKIDIWFWARSFRLDGNLFEDFFGWSFVTISEKLQGFCRPSECASKG